MGDRSGEGYAYGNLGKTFHKLGLCIEALGYHERNLAVVVEQGDRVGEEKAYGNIGCVHRSLGDIERAIRYHELQRSIAKEEGMMADEACAYYELGCSVESQGSEIEALEYYKSSARLFEEIRAGLPCKQTNCFKDEWKINLFDVYQCVYTALRRLYLNQNMVVEALFAAEKGRAQALLDLLGSHFGKNSTQILPSDLLQGDELIIVPEGPLCLVPFAAIEDPAGRYLCESFKIRIAPSLTSLKVIANAPQGYHSEVWCTTRG
ncbi:hypothetical protein ACROYT_G035910 [Oculina patagonica]